MRVNRSATIVLLSDEMNTDSVHSSLFSLYVVCYSWTKFCNERCRSDMGIWLWVLLVFIVWCLHFYVVSRTDKYKQKPPQELSFCRFVSQNSSVPKVLNSNPQSLNQIPSAYNEWWIQRNKCGSRWILYLQRIYFWIGSCPVATWLTLAILGNLTNIIESLS